MEQIPTQKSENKDEAVEVIIEKIYNTNEIFGDHADNMKHAQENGLITFTEAGGKVFVKFLDVKNSPLLPKRLYHVRHPRDSDVVSKKGLIGDFYVQTQNMEVEPEGISLFDNDAEPAVFLFEPDINDDYTITLDPECFGGIPGEYLNAFIVHTDKTVKLEAAGRSIDELRRAA